MIYYPQQFFKLRLNEIELIRHLALNDHCQDLTKEMLQYLGHFYQCVLEIYLGELYEN